MRCEREGSQAVEEGCDAIAAFASTGILVAFPWPGLRHLRGQNILHSQGGERGSCPHHSSSTCTHPPGLSCLGNQLSHPHSSHARCTSEISGNWPLQALQVLTHSGLSIPPEISGICLISISSRKSSGTWEPHLQTPTEHNFLGAKSRPTGYGKTKGPINLLGQRQQTSAGNTHSCSLPLFAKLNSSVRLIPRKQGKRHHSTCA